MGNEFNLFLVESPLQLKNYLYIKDSEVLKDNGEVQIIVRLSDNKLCAEMLKSFISEHNLSNAVHYFYAARGSKWKLILSTLKLILKYQNRFDNSLNLFIGDHRSKWMNILSFFLNYKIKNYIDDGMATVVFYNELISGKRIISERSRILTIFNISSSSSAPVQNIKVTKIKLISDENTAVIIGMPMIESEAMDANDYILYIERAVHHARKSGCENILYIPHRNEDLEFVERRYKFIGVIVNSLGMPIEDWFKQSEMPPGRVYSLYSTALVNLDNLYSGIDCYCFRPCESEFNAKYRDGVNTVYDYIEKFSGISFIE